MPPEDVTGIPQGRLLQELRDANGLGRVRFAVREAMRFGSRQSWWGSRKPRPLPHEGVDLCHFLTEAGELGALGPGARVPVAWDGEVWAVSGDDFIGQSVYVRHEGPRGIFFTAYAHVAPRDGLRRGDRLTRGESLATLADPAGRSLRIAAHLHFSVMTFPDGLSRERLRWATMGAGHEVRFHDPTPLLGEDLLDMGGCRP